MIQNNTLSLDSLNAVWSKIVSQFVVANATLESLARSQAQEMIVLQSENARLLEELATVKSTPKSEVLQKDNHTYSAVSPEISFAPPPISE